MSDYTCHACGEDYIPPVQEQDGIFDLCVECRSTKRLFRIVADSDPESTYYAAGVTHAIERILDELYWQYTEFCDREWNALDSLMPELQDYADPLVLGADRIGTLADFQERLAQYVYNLQALWDQGVAAGILETNVQHTPKGEVFRKWPMTFQIEVFESSLSDLVQNGVCAL